MKRGFTLIELLVVISIIALLLSILAPSLAKVKRQAREIVCISNLHQTGLAILAYNSDNERLPEHCIEEGGEYWRLDLWLARTTI